MLAEDKTKEAIAAELGIGVASVYRICKDLKATQHEGNKIQMKFMGQEELLRKRREDVEREQLRLGIKPFTANGCIFLLHKP